MKITVLVDNNTRINKNFCGEPALSFYIETDDKKIIFDCGYSDIFIQNANKLQIDLLNIDNIILSHAHNDHTAGLFYLKKIYQDSLDFNIKFKIPKIISITNIFEPMIEENFGNIGCPFGKEQLQNIFELSLSDKPVWITKKLCYLGKISNTYQNYNIDEASLVYISDDGLVVITGCAHSGLQNIIEKAKNVTGISKVRTIIGGFHLLNKTEFDLKDIIAYFTQEKIQTLFPCHCTDLNSKIILSHNFEIKEVCAGDTFEF